ncbi:GrpB family protein, partial [Candidatus Poribacteria bacterium]|nr:GrpB family protein [Candidatus Poribacteria bacterium]
MISIDPIEIHPYTQKWPQEFSEIGKKMRSTLGSVALRIDHIGSTSIPGLAAKPIIDIQISVESLEPVEPFLTPLEKLGYCWRQGKKYEKT